jgi:hypothetical protein
VPQRIGTSQPLPTDYSQQDITGRNGVLDGFDKIEAKGDGVNVHKEVGAAKVLAEAII